MEFVAQNCMYRYEAGNFTCGGLPIHVLISKCRLREGVSEDSQW